MDKTEWLQLRSKNINSTESSALFGLSPYTTEFELYHRKKDGDLGEIGDNFRMKAGRLMEPVIAELAAEELGLQVEPYKEYLSLPDIRMGSSFDYITVDGSALIECKNVDSIQYYQKWTETEAPPHIEAQVQHQMEVANIDVCHIAALVGGNDLKIITRHRDKQVGESLRKRIKKFWYDVELRREPEPDYTKDADFILSLHQNAEAGKTHDASSDDILLDDVLKYASIAAEIKDLEAQQKKIKAEILDRVDDASKIVLPGYSVACGMTKDTPPTEITEDMVGQTYGGRKGYRMFRVTKLKEKSK